MTKFWTIFAVINGLAILLFLGVLLWAAFNIHERIGYTLIAQIPALIMLAIRKAFYRSEEK